MLFLLVLTLSSAQLSPCDANAAPAARCHSLCGKPIVFTWIPKDCIVDFPFNAPAQQKIKACLVPAGCDCDPDPINQPGFKCAQFNCTGCDFSRNTQPPTTGWRDCCVYNCPGPFGVNNASIPSRDYCLSHVADQCLFQNSTCTRSGGLCNNVNCGSAAQTCVKYGFVPQQPCRTPSNTTTTTTMKAPTTTSTTKTTTKGTTTTSTSTTKTSTKATTTTTKGGPTPASTTTTTTRATTTASPPTATATGTLNPTPQPSPEPTTATPPPTTAPAADTTVSVTGETHSGDTTQSVSATATSEGQTTVSTHSGDTTLSTHSGDTVPITSTTQDGGSTTTSETGTSTITTSTTTTSSSSSSTTTMESNNEIGVTTTTTTTTNAVTEPSSTISASNLPMLSSLAIGFFATISAFLY